MWHSKIKEKAKGLFEMKTEKEMKKLLKEMKRITKEEFECWEWNSGVGVCGAVFAYEKTGDEEILDYIRAWVERYGFEDRFYGSVNTVIPCAATQLLYKLTGEERYKEVCDVYADWGLNRAVRASNGGIAHVWSVGGDPDYVNQLWADSVFMAAVFFASYGKQIGDEKLVELGFDQIRIHLESLFDEKSGLFFHAYHSNTHEQLGQHWGRGNGWVVASLARVMELFGADAANGLFKKYFVRAMESAYSLKAENGLLHTVITCKDSYTEATGSMLFGYAASVACEIGILDDKYKTWCDDILSALEFDEDGTVKYCSTGTGPESLETYLNTPFKKSCYANGIAMMFLSRFA